MTFGSKLNTLMNLFKVSNAELACGINVDPSLISRWKKGDRKIAANSPHIHNLIHYFLGLKAHGYQKDYLERLIASYLPEVDCKDDAKRILALSEWFTSKKPPECQFAENPIFDKSPIGIVINRHGKILYVNQAYVKMFGYKNAAELQGQDLINQIAPACQEEAKQRIFDRSHNIMNSLSTYETQGMRKDGATFAARVDVKVVNLPDGLAFASFINDISDLKSLEFKYSRQLKTQALLLDIAKSFTRSTFEDMDDLVNDTLMRIGIFDDDDRSYVFIYSDDGKTMSNTHEWCAEGITSEIVNLQDIFIRDLLWWEKSMAGKECIYIPKVSELPAEAVIEKAIFTEQGIQSLIVVPMINEDKLIGFLGFDSVRKTKFWSEEAMLLLETAAQIITNGLIQKKYLYSLNKSD